MCMSQGARRAQAAGLVARQWCILHWAAWVGTKNCRRPHSGGPRPKGGRRYHAHPKGALRMLDVYWSISPFYLHHMSKNRANTQPNPSETKKHGVWAQDNNRQGARPGSAKCPITSCDSPTTQEPRKHTRTESSSKARLMQVVYCQALHILPHSSPPRACAQLGPETI